MTHSNREELNDRFKKVYRLLADQGRIVKNDRQRSKSAFAEKIGTKGHIIDMFLNDARKITYEQAKKLCAHFGVSEAFMFQGKGAPFDRAAASGPQQKLASALGINFSPNILFTSIEAFASNTVGVDYLEENHRFHIPGLQGDLVAFNINGNSMEPTIAAGDMVICMPLETKEEMVNNGIYAVVANQSVWVKRLQKILDESGRWTHLKLISDNAEEYDPFLLELEEVRKLLKVKRRLTGL